MKTTKCWLCVLVTLLAASLLISINSNAQAGDTTWVQTYTFEEQNNPATAYDSPGRRWFVMPEDDGTSYQKILMYHKLKCFEDGTAGNLGFDCGEWDYLAYNYLYDHTGLLDSNFVTHPWYLANNQDFDTAQFSMYPYSNVQIWPMNYSSITTTISEDLYNVGEETQELNYPFQTSAYQSRAQMMWTAQELIDAGMTAGEITGIQFETTNLGPAIGWLKMRIMPTSTTEVSSFEDGSWTELFAWNFGTIATGWQHLQFNQPYSWDGTSNLIIDVEQYNSAASFDYTVKGSDAGYTSAIYTNASDRYIDFNWFDQVNVPDEAFASIDEQVTISFWLNGNEAVQPENGTTFEGVDANNNRVLNSHTPWSNGRVYWDAGQAGGYDRIDKQANAADYEGQWNHWAFTKNTATGEMKMFLNGQLWHSGTNLDNSMAGITKFNIGSAAGWTNYYNGSMDDFTVWSVALDESTIAEWMYKDIDETHPQWNDLQVYYNFNEPNGQLIQDHSQNDFDGVPQGSPNRPAYLVGELFKNFELTSSRPNVNFVSGDYETEALTDEWSVSISVAPISVSEWEVQGNEVVMIDINYYYPEGYSYILDQNGMPIDSTIQEANIQFINQDLSYYQAPYEVIDRYELGRYITPYGINLDLDDGWTWIYDVTDFEPFLHDSVDLNCGNWQELLDLRFAFIEGTPPRDVNRVERIWNGNWGLANWEASIEDKTLYFEAEDEMARIKVTTTGHGFGSGANCAEFCNNIHQIQVNGATEWTWQIMQECADNDLYPQGGTWVYDRAGWCPGMEGRTRDFELTEWVDDGQITLDYDIQTDPYGNYVFEAYMITYGDQNFTHDVEVSQILAPTDFKMASRDNPMCRKPVVRIRNNGSEVLTSCDFTFSVVGGVSQTYTWTGELAFLESADVELSYSDPTIYQGEEEGEILTFEVTVDNPNGQTDQQPTNNYSTSQFVRPPVYTYMQNEGDEDDNRLIFWLTTNNTYWETSWSLYDWNGNTVFERDDFSAAGATYRDTLELNQGCYTFHLKDSDHDGLSFFANNDGNGSFRLKEVGGPLFTTFENDFGKEIKHSFFWRTDLVGIEGEATVAKPELNLYPNPASNVAYLEVLNLGKRLTIELFDAQGRRLDLMQKSNPGLGYYLPMDISSLTPGVYLIRVSDGEKFSTLRMVKE
jgi:hypothetical protein